METARVVKPLSLHYTHRVTYEREAIMRWLTSHRTDPSTKTSLKKRHLAPNLALRSAIEGWVASEAATRYHLVLLEALQWQCIPSAILVMCNLSFVSLHCCSFLPETSLW